MTVKQKVLDVVNSMPENATYEQINIDLAILQSIEESKDGTNRITTEQMVERTNRAIQSD